MEDKYFTVKLEIAAPNKETVERMLERMPRADRIFDSEIVDPDEKHFECRIRYDKDWCGHGEHFVFENRWTDEKDWSLDTAFKLLDYGEEKGAVINYQALTKIRELQYLGVPFYFKKGEA